MVMDRVGQWLGKSAALGSQSAKPASVPGPHRSTPKDNEVSALDDAEIAMLSASLVMADGAAKSQRLSTGNLLCLQPDASYVVRNPQGDIVKSCDVLGFKRDYYLDAATGVLSVKRFGIWSNPVDANLDQTTGSFCFRNGNTRIAEGLDGIHTQTNLITGDEIHTNHKAKWELVVLANGETWQRETNDVKETFAMWKHGKITFHSETYFESARTEALTPSGRQALICVSRLERSMECGDLVREKFTFKNTLNNRKDVALTLHFGSCVLMVKHVASILTVFSDGRPHQTTYSLSVPTSLRVDIGPLKGTIQNVVELVSTTGLECVHTRVTLADGTDLPLDAPSQSIG